MHLSSRAPGIGNLNRRQALSRANVRGKSIAAFEQVQIELPRDFACAELLEVRRQPLGVEQGKPALTQTIDQRPERDLRCAGGAMKHRFAEKRAADRDAVEAADEFVSRPGLDRMSVSQTRAGECSSR